MDLKNFQVSVDDYSYLCKGLNKKLLYNHCHENCHTHG
ncbi:hypothetical protein THERMOT_1332 [Bathymodiolus thermophilus thioautotrophic gill symbiont]|uniref:Uncharacterized protein n=1 Tax=Bathymodiolus thermophilus thioautotrophic gill symbiont TaxID=2360 RepID=A0A8H9CH05_9GAMM|nr:hypothetical protein THERMOS_659 [Bathymodiolus thermophilus thioautotrophic gill symbiont]CAB5500946.1 hypothetical protein THERMOT_1332 [Bathymodiolus thermophilus thioautotrophic gill symbiont]